jgi:hypothetical protein
LLLTGGNLRPSVEKLLLNNFSIYWREHPTTDEKRQKVIELIRQRVSMTDQDVLRSILNRRIPPFKAAGILDKIVDEVYGGNSTYFLKKLVG